MSFVSLRILGVAALLLAGCQTTNHVKARPDRAAQQRRVLTGSHIPTPIHSLPPDDVSANTPPESLSRDRPSLYPTEPVVGASPNTR